MQKIKILAKKDHTIQFSIAKDEPCTIEKMVLMKIRGYTATICVKIKCKIINPTLHFTPSAELDFGNMVASSSNPVTKFVTS